jgi:hypothetical protein
MKPIKLAKIFLSYYAMRQTLFVWWMVKEIEKSQRVKLNMVMLLWLELYPATRIP